MRFGALALAAAALLGIAGVSWAASDAEPRVTVVGDSVAKSLDYVVSARTHLGRGLDVRSNTAVCRRLVAASCRFRGAQPKTALEVVSDGRGSLGSVVVVDVGYNDWAAVYDVDRVMGALEAAGVRSAIWVTLRATTENYARSNARILQAARRWKGLVVADWDAYSRGKPWFRSDGVHLTATGADGLARLLRPLVVAGLRGS